MDSTDFGFELRECQEADAVVLSLHGDLDIAVADELRARLDALKDRATPVRLDLSSLDFMDSSGMACIAQAVREARDSGWSLSIGRELTAQVKRLLELADGERLFWPSGR